MLVMRAESSRTPIGPWGYAYHTFLKSHLSCFIVDCLSASRKMLLSTFAMYFKGMTAVVKKTDINILFTQELSKEFQYFYLIVSSVAKIYITYS